MLCFVKINDSSGIWANRDEALSYLSKGCKAYTDTDEKTGVTEEELLAASQTDRGGDGERGTVAVAAGVEG